MNREGYWIIPFSIVLALMLTLLPLPDWLRYFRPEWVALICIYWALATPLHFGLVSAWIAGLALDVATGSLLGQHALGLTIVVYFILYQHQRLRLAPISQQGLIIFLLILVKQTITLSIGGIIDQKPESLLLFYYPALIGILLWPLLMIILRGLRRSANLK
jgi:rod shape-determining protein MreD